MYFIVKITQILVLTSRWSLCETNRGKDASSSSHKAAFWGAAVYRTGGGHGEKARRFWPRQDQAEAGGQVVFRLYT